MVSMSLGEDGDGGMIFHVVADDGLCLVCRFLMDKPVRTQIMKTRLAGVWRPEKGVAIQDIEPGLFLFQFYHRLDL